jgi:hypothetical protein
MLDRDGLHEEIVRNARSKRIPSATSTMRQRAP